MNLTPKAQILSLTRAQFHFPAKVTPVSVSQVPQTIHKFRVKSITQLTPITQLLTFRLLNAETFTSLQPIPISESIMYGSCGLRRDRRELLSHCHRNARTNSATQCVKDMKPLQQPLASSPLVSNTNMPTPQVVQKE